MKRYHVPYILIGFLCIGLLAVVLSNCRPDDLKDISLGAPPKASFQIIGGGDQNTITLVNTTPPVGKYGSVSIPYWTVEETQQTAEGDSAHFRFTFAGTYTIKLLVVAHGGIDSAEQKVTINQNDTTACQNSVLGFIAGCTSKTWQFAPEAYAYKVGPNPDDGSWWGNPASDVTGARVCDFNDTYTFYFDANGTFVYDNKGDFYTEDYLGRANWSCDVNADLPPAQQPWASGTFRYQVIEGTGVAKKGQLKVIGLGAHIGLAKVTNQGETKTAPVVNTITYDILDMYHDPAGFDVLKLGINDSQDPNNPVWWTYTLRSY
ncbi:MAG: hypothetical protein IMW88_09505 [Thermoflavifilum sp.]|uniref:hypothetical protein n=1 Tax=Thermoflavifilum sp. TaxID=1968839 RepID=UPI0018A5A91F|nr:hypothetical protein [Thermoflavifilum sp.]QOR75570.1 MAG: hypothetical protein IMW88_09505 [Thermoflavifilum sp.]